MRKTRPPLPASQMHRQLVPHTTAAGGLQTNPVAPPSRPQTNPAATPTQCDAASTPRLPPRDLTPTIATLPCRPAMRPPRGLLDCLRGSRAHPWTRPRFYTGIWPSTPRLPFLPSGQLAPCLRRRRARMARPRRPSRTLISRPPERAKRDEKPPRRLFLAARRAAPRSAVQHRRLPRPDRGCCNHARRGRSDQERSPKLPRPASQARGSPIH